MTNFKCNICGSLDFFQTDDGFFRCKGCGCNYTMEQVRSIVFADKSDDLSYAAKATNTNDTEKNDVSIDLLDKAKCDSSDFLIENGVLVKYNGREEEVVIPDCVSVIGKEAFMNGSVKSVVISEGVKKIEDRAFGECTNLSSVTIPSSVTTIGREAFEFCIGLDAVNISDVASWCGISFGFSFDEHLNKIYDSNPLYFAHKLYVNGKLVTDMAIPSSVTSISDHAFDGCSCLESVKIPSNVTKIGEGAFSGCYIESIEIGTDTDAFMGSKSLKNVTILEGVKSVAVCAFHGCTNLSAVTIPESVKEIGGGAFEGCNEIKDLYISDLAAWCSVSMHYQAMPHAQRIYVNGKLLTDLVIPSSVTSINGNTFNRCLSLKSVTIPASVKSIGSGAFTGCRELTFVTMPEGLTKIEPMVFAYCTSLTSITIPRSVESIERWAFEGCTGLKSVTVLNSNTEISGDAFPENVELNYISIK